MIEMPKSFDRASALVNAWLIAAPSRARGGLRSRDIRTASLLTTVSVSGKRDSEGQRQLAQNRLQAGKGLHGDRNADVGARQLRAFWKSQGNLAVRKSAWWWMQSSPNRSHPSNSPITGKILGISHGLTLLSDFRRVIREQIQRLAAKFPAQRNWEFLSRNWETTRRKREVVGPVRVCLQSLGQAGSKVAQLP